MNNFSSKMLLTKKVIQMTFLIMSSLLIIDYAWGAPRYWMENNFKVSKDVYNNTIYFKFKFFDYARKKSDNNCYLEWCDFSYSTNGSNYTRFMRSETSDHRMKNGSSCLDMTHKLKGVELKFTDCITPTSGTTWIDFLLTQTVEVLNRGNVAHGTFIWKLNEQFKNIKSIKLVGQWCVNGNKEKQHIYHIYEVLPIISTLNAELNTDSKQMNVSVPKNNQSEYNVVKVYSEADAVVIKGKNTGDKINIYTTSGEQIKSSVAYKDVINIKLPANKIYIVHIGQTRYKVAL